MCSWPAWCVPAVGTGSRSSRSRWPSGWRGAGHRLIGQRLGVAADTVRGWVRRVVRRADQLRGAATEHLHLLDPVAVPPEPTGSDLGDALAALAAATQAATGAALRPGSNRDRDGRCSGGSG